MKKDVKIIFIIAIAVLIALLTLTAIFFWYVPRYVTSKKMYDASEKGLEGETTVMTFNVRCYSPTDLFKKSWFYRADLVVDVIEKNAPDVIAFQEVAPMHVKFLKDRLKGYSFVNAYRTQKGAKEGLMIAYRTNAFEVVEEGYFWISETPEKESKDWGTAFPRIAVYATLKSVKSGKVVTVMDVHLDHVSAEARKEGMRVLLEQKAKLNMESLILLGDMNDYDDSLMYAKAIEGGLRDAKLIAENSYVGSGATYQGFGSKLDGRRIDYFFLTPDLEVSSYAVIDETYDGVYPSDHFPLVIKLK